MEAVDLLVGGILYAIGVLTGRAWRRDLHPEEPDPICLCRHHYGNHDASGKCNAQVEQAIKWDSYGDPYKFEYVPCTCLHYTGPEPLPRYIAGE